MKPPASDAEQRIDRLWVERRRQPFLLISVVTLLLFLLATWICGDFGVADFLSERRQRNLARFLTEIRPAPLQGRDWNWSSFVDWSGRVLEERGFDAAIATLAIAVLAISIAAAASLALAPLAARNFACPEPYVAGGRKPSWLHVAVWRSLLTLTRCCLILMRSLPEYVLAFLILAVLGPSAWPAVLALALHNAGILGRLNAETIENRNDASLVALRGLGARRSQIGTLALLPIILPRFLLYFFYRWETCVREATVLGMLGVVSLGYWIADARSRGRYDEFLFLVLVGAAIVLAGDLVSALARRWVRRAT